MVFLGVAGAITFGFFAFRMMDRGARTVSLEHALHLVDQGSLAQAGIELDRVIANGNGDKLAFRARAWVRSELGNVPGAIEDYGSVIERDLMDAEAYASRAALNVAMANQAEADEVEHLIRAIEDYERALGVGGEEWAAYEAVEALQDAARTRVSRLVAGK